MTPEQEAALDRFTDFMARMYFKYGVHGLPDNLLKQTKADNNGEKLTKRENN